MKRSTSQSLTLTQDPRTTITQQTLSRAKPTLSLQNLHTILQQHQHPRLQDLRNQNLPAMLRQHHSQAMLSPQSIIFNYHYPFSRKNMQLKEEQDIGTAFFKTRQESQYSSKFGKTTMQGNWTGGGSAAGAFNTISSMNGRPPRSVVKFQNGEMGSEAGRSSAGMMTTSNSSAQIRIQQYVKVDLEEMYYHYKRLSRLHQALQAKEPLAMVQRILDSLLRTAGRERLSGYDEVAKDQNKKGILRQGQNLEILLVHYLDLIVIELMGPYPPVAKQAIIQAVYYLSQTYLSIIEIVLYRIPEAERSKTWALRLIELVAHTTVSTSSSSSVGGVSAQVRQKEALTRIKEHNQIVVGLLTNKILNAKIKSYTANIISYVKQSETLTPQKMREYMEHLLQFSRRAKKPNHGGVGYSDGVEDEYVMHEDDYDFYDTQPNEYQSVYNFSNSTTQEPSARLIKEEQRITKYSKFLNRLQQEKHGGYLPKLSDQEQVSTQQQGVMQSQTYTLVLDLDETLVHYAQGEEQEQQGDVILFRPHLHEFLTEMAKYYEIVIFTAALQDYADYILDKLDPDHSLISYRLYRQHALYRQTDGVYLKDLTRLGRDLSRTMILDNVKENFSLQKDNGIFIRTWLNDQDDTVLIELIPLLKQIVEEQVPDVRISLRKYRDTVTRYIQEQRVTGIRGDTLFHHITQDEPRQQQTPSKSFNQSRMGRSKLDQL